MLDAGIPVPPEFEVRLAEPAEPYWTAFAVLGQARTMAGGMVPLPNPIAVSEILGYAGWRGLPVDETLALVQLMDAAWLGWMHSQTTRKRRDDQPDGRPPDPR